MRIKPLPDLMTSYQRPRIPACKVAHFNWNGGSGQSEYASVGTCYSIMVYSKSPCNTARIIEVPHGPVVDCVLEHGYKCCHQFQAVGALSGSGFARPNDRRDARVLSEGVRSDPNFLRILDRVNAEITQPREWYHMADDLTARCTRLALLFAIPEPRATMVLYGGEGSTGPHSHAHPGSLARCRVCAYGNLPAAW